MSFQKFYERQLNTAEDAPHMTGRGAGSWFARETMGLPTGCHGATRWDLIGVGSEPLVWPYPRET